MNAITEQWELEQQLIDLRVAVICRTILEPYRDTNKNPEAFNPFKHLPFLGRTEQPVEQPKKKGPAAAEYEEYLLAKLVNRMMGGKGGKHGR